MLSCLFALVLKLRNRQNNLLGYRRDMIFIGVPWITISVVVEVLRINYATQGGRFASVSWADYNILEGGLMGFIWLAELIAPCVLGIIMFRRRDSEL